MWRAIGYEIIKFKAQKKNYVMIFGHLAFIALCYLGYQSSRSTGGFLRELQRTELDPGFVDFLIGCFDGPFFARLVMVPTFLILMPIVVTTLAGDSIAGEMQDGSLKLHLARPRSRTGVILAKFFATYLVTLAYSLYFATVTLLIAILLRGWSPTQVIFMFGSWGVDFTTMREPQAIERYYAMVVYFSFSLMALGSMTLFFSTLFNRMTAATIVAITVYFVSYIVAALPFTEVLKPFLISETMGGGTAFMFWVIDIPWQKLTVNLALLGLYIAGFLTLSIINFNTKDIK